mmetsp:Transcript_5868/g.13908  ORF Transcript_5868/g.13908 Transcript_5868/m.13908 type:complete len:317 (+) Transcript_5868:1198-2148(+)
MRRWPSDLPSTSSLLCSEPFIKQSSAQFRRSSMPALGEEDVPRTYSASRASTSRCCGWPDKRRSRSTMEEAMSPATSSASAEEVVGMRSKAETSERNIEGEREASARRMNACSIYAVVFLSCSVEGLEAPDCIAYAPNSLSTIDPSSGQASLSKRRAGASSVPSPCLHAPVSLAVTKALLSTSLMLDMVVTFERDSQHRRAADTCSGRPRPLITSSAFIHTSGGEEEEEEGGGWGRSATVLRRCLSGRAGATPATSGTFTPPKRLDRHERTAVSSPSAGSPLLTSYKTEHARSASALTFSAPSSAAGVADRERRVE